MEKEKQDNFIDIEKQEIGKCMLLVNSKRAVAHNFYLNTRELIQPDILQAVVNIINQDPSPTGKEGNLEIFDKDYVKMTCLHKYHNHCARKVIYQGIYNGTCEQECKGKCDGIFSNKTVTNLLDAIPLRYFNILRKNRFHLYKMMYYCDECSQWTFSNEGVDFTDEGTPLCNQGKDKMVTFGGINAIAFQIFTKQDGHLGYLFEYFIGALKSAETHF